MNETESNVFTIAEKSKSSGLVPAAEIIKTSLDRIEYLYQQKSAITGIASGFSDLDKMTNGFQPSDLIIIAARPSMGKTALVLNIAQHVALREKKNVAFFSLEMSQEQVMMRLLGSEARVNLSDLRVGRVADSVWPKLISVANKFSESPLYIDDTSGISPYEVRAKCRRLKSQKGLDMVIVDYLQIMDLKTKVESRERAISEISRNMKELAKELKIPVVVLSQINRGVEVRTDRRPMLSDLRESVSIEQDADVVMMIYRDEYYDRENAGESRPSRDYYRQTKKRSGWSLRKWRGCRNTELSPTSLPSRVRPLKFTIKSKRSVQSRVRHLPCISRNY